MIGIFSYDGPIFRDKNGVLCDTKFTDEVFSRYTQYVDLLYVVIRVKQIDVTFEEAHLTPITLPQVHVVSMPNVVSPKGFLMRNKQKSKLKKLVAQTDMFFFRVPGILCNMLADLCIEAGKPYLVEVGGCAWDAYFHHGVLGKLVAPIVDNAQKKTVMNASHATYVTDTWLQNRYPTNGKSCSASNVYLSSFDENNIKRRIAHYEKSKPQVYKIGTLASVEVKYKGHDQIIKAMSVLKKEGVRLVYEMVGRGNPDRLRKMAEKYDVSDQVVFLGQKRHDEIWSWLDSIDIYAQPSKQEGLPRAVIEAMNRGCICIGSNIAGIPELLEEDELFSNNDIKCICQIIRSIVNEKDHSVRILSNFNKSKKYDLNVLNENRKVIFSDYQQLVCKQS